MMGKTRKLAKEKLENTETAKVTKEKHGNWPRKHGKGTRDESLRRRSIQAGNGARAEKDYFFVVDAQCSRNDLIHL